MELNNREKAIVRSASEIEKGNHLIFDNDYCFIHKGKESFIIIDKVLNKIYAEDTYFNQNGILIEFKKLIS